jgi:hypothetical protein
MIGVRWNFALWVLFGLFVVCCNQREATTREGKASLDTLCYTFIQKQDTIKLSFSVNESKIEGALQFRFYEKDKTTGSIEGEMKGDTIFATYQFMSEGTLSVREVAFLKTDTALIMGIGEVTSVEDKEVFKNHENISFPAGLIFRQVPCDHF